MTARHFSKFPGGVKNVPEYQAWAGMKQRCYNPRNHAYRYYGGRGIDVCERWRGSFRAFFEDLGPRPHISYSLDRLDGSKGYHCGKCPDCEARGNRPNCRWATVEEQKCNRGKNPQPPEPKPARKRRNLESGQIETPFPPYDPYVWRWLARRKKPPCYSWHDSGQARVKMGPRGIYLGKYNSLASCARFQLLLELWQHIRAGLVPIPEEPDQPTTDSPGDYRLSPDFPVPVGVFELDLPGAGLVATSWVARTLRLPVPMV